MWPYRAQTRRNCVHTHYDTAQPDCSLADCPTAPSPRWSAAVPAKRDLNRKPSCWRASRATVDVHLASFDALVSEMGDMRGKPICLATSSRGYGPILLGISLGGPRRS